ncbi:hypothetical protein [Kitasatospora sp. NPDC058046]|uniref:hypothetical protein n=1 Tax=Kitasatospora sp. NPDC058046 TaxID=3346312 RepID=UPI0036DA0267
MHLLVSRMDAGASPVDGASAAAAGRAPAPSDNRDVAAIVPAFVKLHMGFSLVFLGPDRASESTLLIGDRARNAELTLGWNGSALTRQWWPSFRFLNHDIRIEMPIFAGWDVLRN